jgi:hypothetical protein
MGHGSGLEGTPRFAVDHQVSAIEDAVNGPVFPRVARVVKRRVRYVAVTDHDGRFLRLLERREILEEIAATYVAAMETS